MAEETNNNVVNSREYIDNCFEYHDTTDILKLNHDIILKLNHDLLPKLITLFNCLSKFFKFVQY